MTSFPSQRRSKGSPTSTFAKLKHPKSTTWSSIRGLWKRPQAWIKVPSLACTELGMVLKIDPPLLGRHQIQTSTSPRCLARREESLIERSFTINHTRPVTRCSLLHFSTRAEKKVLLTITNQRLGSSIKTRKMTAQLMTLKSTSEASVISREPKQEHLWSRRTAIPFQRSIWLKRSFKW